jgi:hypothetical protein
MIFDRQNEFSNRQVITATAVSTDVLNFGVAQTPKHAANPITRDLGKGRKPDVRIQVVESFNNLTSLTVELQVDDNEAFSSPRVAMTTTVPLARLTRGSIIMPDTLPRGIDEQFMRLNYIVTGTAPTLGRISAGLVFGNEERDV